MRRKNPRLAAAGAALLAMAAAFFLFMLSIASRSNDPVALMQTVGQVSGFCGGLGIALIAIGRIGTKVRPEARETA